jgi:hypothetical protein
MSSIKEGVCRLLVSNEQEFVNVDTYLINELAERQFKRYEIEGDGHCLLNAIKHQLRNSNLLLPSISVWLCHKHRNHHSEMFLNFDTNFLERSYIIGNVEQRS